MIKQVSFTGFIECEKDWEDRCGKLQWIVVIFVTTVCNYCKAGHHYFLGTKILEWQMIQWKAVAFQQNLIKDCMHELETQQGVVIDRVVSLPLPSGNGPPLKHRTYIQW